MKKKLISGILAVSVIAVSSITAFAAQSVKNGALIFNGGQTSDKVFSEIYDEKTPENGNDDGLAWTVKASVKVGSKTYTSGFTPKYAYTEADRVWYANETSWWDADRIGGY